MSRDQRNTSRNSNINIDGNVSDSTIHIGDTTTVGYTSEEVSALLTQITSTFQPKSFDGRCPYKGLDVFEEEDAELFFGREKLIEDLVSRVKDSHTLFITGPSGSGKSSLARAGLIHALRQGAIKGSERWLYATMKPGRDPIGELGRATAGLAGTTNVEDEIRGKGGTNASIFARWCEIALKEGREKRFVLFIDQFEEVFTQINREDERVAFLNLLTHAAEAEGGRVNILFAMRSDFVPNCASYPQLNALLNQQFIQIGAMQPEELVSAIAQPALRVGLRIDPDLVAQVINDMKGEPGALPLMQFALKDLFDAVQVRGGLIQLTLEDYLQRGGIQKSLERHADVAFASLGTDEQKLARSIFSRLIEIGRGTQDTKRTALFDELIPANAQAGEVQGIIRKLADARLITTDEAAGKDTVTISHEKLIDAWPWLKKLVNENRDVIALQNEIVSAAKEWEEHKRDVSYLYNGARLINAREQLETKKLMLSGLAQQFIQAGRAKQRRGQVTLVTGISAVIVLLVLAVIIFSRQSNANAQLAQQNADIASTAQAAGTLAVAQKAIAESNAKEAQRQEKIARAGELAAFADIEQDRNFDLALLLGVEAFKTYKNSRTEVTLRNLTIMNFQLLRYLPENISPVFSPKGDILVTLVCMKYSDYFSDRCIQSELALWDISTPAKPDKLSTLLEGQGGSIESIAFNPDGKILVAGNCIKFNGDGNCLKMETILWNADNPAHPIKLSSLTGQGGLVAFVPNRKILASGGYDSTITLWDVTDPSNPLRLSTLLESSNGILEFSPDGKIAAVGNGNDIVLWNIGNPSSPAKIVTLSGNAEFVISAVFSPDGKILASGSGDDTLVLWNVSTPNNSSQISVISDNSYGKLYGISFSHIAFSPDGNTLVSGSHDNTIVLWDVSDPYRPTKATALSGHRDSDIPSSLSSVHFGHKSYLNSVTFSPDGKTLASAGFGGIILWNLPVFYFEGEDSFSINDIENIKNYPSDGIKLSTLLFGQIAEHTVQNVAFSPDGKTMVTGESNKNGMGNCYFTISNVSNPAKPTWISTSLGPCYFLDIALSPDGKTLAVAATISETNSSLMLWGVSDRNIPTKLATLHFKTVHFSLAFSPDGKTLALGGCREADKVEDCLPEITLWDVSNPTELDKLSTLQRQIQVSSAITAGRIAFSPDGKILAAGGYLKSDNMYGAEEETVLWNIKDTANPAEFATITSSGSLVAFSPNGKMLAIQSETYGTITLWNVSNPSKPTTFSTLPFYFYGEPSNITFSPDGKTMASRFDYHAILWDVSDPRMPTISATLDAWISSPSSFAFSPDGKILAQGLAGMNGVVLWDMDPESWMQKTCNRIGRNLTRAEWAQYFPNEEYRATCPQWPLEQEEIQTPTPRP
jgi:WD40 repeat protein